ncbi:hypothetical protein [Luedemannella helvata]|uniref:hypothetical protein n=1 Tax=Luedemannella helvata TaxID=349315 RepID=UPI0031CE954C
MTSLTTSTYRWSPTWSTTSTSTWLRRLASCAPCRWPTRPRPARPRATSEPEELPLGEPQLVFYAGNDWLLHFQEGRLPGCDPYGLGVVFDRHQPVRLEDLSGAEPID